MWGSPVPPTTGACIRRRRDRRDAARVGVGCRSQAGRDSCDTELGSVPGPASTPDLGVINVNNNPELRYKKFEIRQAHLADEPLFEAMLIHGICFGMAYALIKASVMHIGQAVGRAKCILQNLPVFNMNGALRRDSTDIVDRAKPCNMVPVLARTLWVSAIRRPLVQRSSACPARMRPSQSSRLFAARRAMQHSR